MGSEVIEGMAWTKPFLEGKGAIFRFVEHEAVTKPVDSARVRGVQLHQIAKALVYMADGKPLLVVLPGDTEVDESKLSKAAGAHEVRLAGPGEVKDHTGCPVGLVPPLITGIRKIVDKSLLDNEEVSFNAGIATAGIIIKTKELLSLLGDFREADVSFGRTMVGLECHVQLATESKLFCGCPVVAEEPNSACCPVCLGHPGSKPVLNAKALLYAVKVALAMNCKVNGEFFFSRKTYFYPDMAKDFQITQYEIPVGVNGFVNLPSGKKVRIRRVHLEEDPAALVHEGGVGESDYCLVDYNRSGVPLVEVVTEPDMDSPQDARDFLDQLTTVLSYLQVYSPATGTLKADTNISIWGHPRVEVKNVNGKRGVEKALVFEIARQRNLLLHNQEAVRETRAFDEKTQTTKSLRTKETEEDYGYIFEPDLTAIALGQAEVEKIRSSLPELHESKARRFVKQFGLDEYTAGVLTRNYSLSKIFSSVVEKDKIAPDAAAKFLTRELMAVVNRNSLDLDALELDAAEVSSLLKMFLGGSITEKVAKEAIIAYLTKGIKPTDFIEKHGLAKDMGNSEIMPIVEKVLAANPKAVADLKAGNNKTLNFLVGQVMRLTKAKAEPRVVQGLIEKKIKGA